MAAPIIPMDVLTIGESMLRLSVPSGALLADQPAFEVHIAGAESNVAVAVAQMGYRAAWWSRLTNNALGQRIAQTIAHYGVDCSGIAWTEEDRVGTYYLQASAPPRPSRVIYDRAGSATSRMTANTFDLSGLRATRRVHLTGITAALSDGCYALVERVIAYCRDATIPVVFDVNYRALLWTPEVCCSRLTPLLGQVETLIIGQQDAALVFGLKDSAEQTIRALHDLFPVKHLVLTLGEEGALGLEDGVLLQVNAYPATVIDRIGAGDAFAAGVICGLLEGDFDRGLHYGTALSALKIGLTGDLFRLSRADVLHLLDADRSHRTIR
jgi:2-dehydro-3-deoxygluconokinase